MGKAVAAITCIVLSTAFTRVLAQDQGGERAATHAPSTGECVHTDLQLVQVPGDGVYRLFDDLAIKAAGGCYARLQAARAKDPAAKIVLHLNDVPMSGVTLLSTTSPRAGEEVLNFRLVRESADADNRAAWDRLLGPEDGSDFDIRPALSIAGDPAVSVVATGLQFGVASRKRIVLTLLGGVVVFVLAYAWCIRHPKLLRDSDGAYSLGKSQMAFWGLLVFLTFVGVWIVTGAPEQLPDQVLILLGISAATGVGAVAIGSGKTAALQSEQVRLETELLQNPAVFAPASQARLKEIRSTLALDITAARKFLIAISSDGDGLSFHRLQAVLWTLVLGVIFVVSVATVISMPTFDESLLILMGISSGTYLGFKIPEKS